MSKNILIISAHTYFQNSTVNKHILDELRVKLPKAEIVQLDTVYPDHKINVKAEQDRLTKADIVVFQFPMFWFNTPTLIQLYLEEVFTHGWAYGSKGHALNGKTLLLSLTSGEAEEKLGKIEDFYLNLKQTAIFTGMKYGGIVNSSGYSHISGEESRKRALEIADKHVAKLVETLNKL